MDRSRTVLFLVVAAVLVAAAVLLALFFSGFGGETAEVRLPQTFTGEPGEPDGPAAEGLLLANVTPETVQAVVSTLVRPDSYSRQLTVTRFWEGGSRTEAVSVWQKSGMLRVLVDSAGEQKNILYYQGSVSIWYGSDSEHVFHYQSEDPALGDSLQQIPTYEDLLALDPASIREAGYIRHGGGWRIMASAETAGGGLGVYYISIETGLLEEAERWEDGRLVYSLSAGEADLSAPSDVAFLIGAAIG